jgi:hypothetical protein
MRASSNITQRILIPDASLTTNWFMEAVLSLAQRSYILMLQVGRHQRVSASLVFADIGEIT